MRPAAATLALFLSGLLGAALAGPISRDNSKCSTQCSTGPRKFQYEPDKTYVYSYWSQTKMGLTEDESEDVKHGSGSEIRAKVQIQVKGPCEMVLKLSDVSLSGTNRDQSFKKALEAHSLPFSFDDGDIRDLCPTPQDQAKPYVLNTKRAILSTLKNTMKNLEEPQESREVDIAGDCLTKYTIVKGGAGVSVTKFKDLTSCRQRHSSPIAIFGTPYDIHESSVHNAPLLVGMLECQQNILDGQVKNVECQERNVFSPLSRSGKGAVVHTIAKLDFKEQQEGAETNTASVGKRTNLLFTSGQLQATAPTDGSKVRQVLQQLCATGKEGIRTQTPALVSKLAGQLRNLPYDVAARIYEDLDNKQICQSDIVRDIYVDALSMAGTEGAVKLLVKLIKEDKLSSARRLTWLTSLAFNSHADEGVIQALLPLIKDYDVGGRQALLGVSSMVHSFCAQDREGDCKDVPAVKELIASLQKQLGNKCKSNDRDEEHRIRETLSAFENMGRTGDARDLLMECFSFKENPLEVRHAAILAFRRAPCEDEVTRKMESLYQDTSEDAAIRIYAYRGAMRCPDTQLVQTVMRTMEKEQVQQVGAYVMSHVSNMKETSSPSKQGLRQLLDRVEFKKKFPSDPRKYSQYTEATSFSNRLNMGAGYEVSLVRSPKTFVPKSMLFNMSTYFMGKEVNILEAGMEMDGMTHLLEKYFGEDGYFSKLSLDQLMVQLGLKEDSDEYNKIQDDQEDEAEDEERRRSTRDVKNGPLTRINLLHDRMGVTTPNDPKVTAHLSILGRKIALLHGTDIKGLFELKEAFSIMEMLTELAHKQKAERSVSFQLLDTKMSLPAFSGMEVTLAVNATSVMAVQADGKFDIRQLLTPERGADIDGRLCPSGAVEVNGLMSVDSGVHKSALRVIANLHTSSCMEGKILIKDGRLLDVKINMPKDKMELITFKSEAYSSDGDGGEKAVTPAAFHTLDSCTGFLDRYLGVDVCTSLKAPKPLYDKNGPMLPVSGPVQLEVSLKKTDKSLRGYTLHVEVPGEHEYNDLTYKMDLDTPGSSVDRHFALEARLNRQGDEKTLNYKLTSPFKKLAGTAFWVGRPELKKGRLSLTVDEKDSYALQGELKTLVSSGRTDLQPSLEIHLPKGEPIVLKGSLAFVAGKKDQLIVDLNSNRPIKNPSYLRGTIVKEGEFSSRKLDGRLKLSTDITLFTPFLEARLHGTGDKQNTVYSSDVALNYKVPSKSQHNAKFTAKVQNLSTRHLTKFSTKVESTFSQLPEANTLVSWDFQRKPKEHLENDFKISNGPHYMNEEGEFLHVLQVSKMQGVEQNGRKGETENRLMFKLPALNQDLDLNVKTRWNVIEKPSFNFDADLKYKDNKHVQAAINYNYISSKPVEMTIEARLSTPDNEYVYQDRVKERSPNEFEGKTMVQWARGRSASMDYIYRIKTDSSKIHHEVDIQLNSPLSRLPIQQKALFRVTKDGVDVRSHTRFEGQPLYSIDAKMSRSGPSKVEIQVASVEGELKIQNDDKLKNIKFMIKQKDNHWNYFGSTEYRSDRNDKAVEVLATWNEKEDPFNRISLIASLTKSNPFSKIDIHGQYRKDVSLRIQGDIDKNTISGTHNVTVNLKTPRTGPVLLIYHHEMVDQTAHCRLRYFRNTIEQLEIHSNFKTLLGREIDVSAGIELKSRKSYLDGKELSVSFKHERRSGNYLANVRAQNSRDNPYSLNLEYVTEPQGSRKKIRARAKLLTPIPSFRSREALVVMDLSRSVTKINADLSNEQNKNLRTELMMQGSLSKGSANIKIVTPFKKFRSLKAGVEVDGSNGYTCQSFLEMNDDRMLEWDSKIEYKDGSTVDSTVSFRSLIGPKYDIRVHAFHNEAKKSFDFNLKKEDEDIFATEMLAEREDESQNAQVVLKTAQWTWTLEAKNQQLEGRNQKYSISSRGLGRPLEVTLNWKETHTELAPELTICPGLHGSDCLVINGLIRIILTVKLVHFEVGLSAREGQDQEISFNYLIKGSGNDFLNTFHADFWGKELGFETKVEGDEQKASLKVKLPSRELQSLVRWTQSDDTVNIQGEIMMDALRQPSKKLTLDITHKSTPITRGVRTQDIIILNHPDMQNPIKADVQSVFRNVRVGKPMEIKAEIDYSPDSNQKLFAEFDLEHDDVNATFTFGIHTADRQALDVAVQAHVGENRDLLTAGGNWKFIIPDKKWEGMNYFEINTKNDQIHYYYRSPVQQYELHGNWKSDPGKSFDMDTHYIENGEESGVRLVVNTLDESCAELIIYQHPDSPKARYHICLDFKDRELLSLTAESYTDDEKTTDAKVVFDRRDQKSFSASIHWQPERLDDILQQIIILGDKIENDDTLENAILKGAETLQNAAEAIQGSLISPLVDYLSKEVYAISEELASDFKHVRSVAHRIYSDLPDVEDTLAPVGKAAVQILEYVRQLFDDLIPKEAVEQFQKAMQAIKKRVKRLCGYGTVCYSLNYAYQRKGLEGVGEYIYGVLENMPNNYYKALVAAKDVVVENLPSLYIPNVDLEPLQKAMQDLASWICKQLKPLLSSEAVKAAQEKLAEYVKRLKDSWKEGSKALREELERELKELASNPHVKVFLDILEEFLQEIQKEVTGLNLQKTLEQLEVFVQDFDGPEKLKNSVRVVNLDPENGKIDVEIRLPKSPEEIKSLLMASNAFSKKAEQVQDKTDMFPGVVDVLNQAQATLKQEWIPPFKGYAQVIGGQHFVTFDSTFYDFAGECSYLLARDFADGNFSVVVNYKGPGNKGAGSIQKSITVLANSKVIEIDPQQETVIVDDQEVEMPYSEGPVSLVRRGSMVVVDYKRGLSVTCHLVHDFCTTTISGWYHGKTAGLFGTYDHEPANDFLRPRGGEEIQDSTAFARSWEVSSGCRFRPLTHEVQVQPDFYGHEVCRKVFADNSSPLRPCFQEMNSEEYMKMCVRQVAIQGSANQGMCTVAAAFANVCRQKHYPVSIPSQCLKCQSRLGESIEYGSRRRLEYQQTLQSADVVFVVEERQCNRAVVKELDGLARMVDRALQDSGLSQNRFGLLGFGGKDREGPAHSHTARGKVLFDQKDLVLATEKMNFDRDSAEDPDTFQALTEAIRYPFRLGVSKNVILLTCSQCNQDAMSVSYPDIQNLLLQRGIMLHTLGKWTISVRKSSTKARSIYGMDAQKVYTSKDRKAEGDTDLRSQVSYPKDICVALAQEVGGSFFTTQPVIGGSPNEAKNWKSLLGRRVALTAQPPSCQECECSAGQDDVPQPLCAPCRAPKPARPVSNDINEEEDEY